MVLVNVQATRTCYTQNGIGHFLIPQFMLLKKVKSFFTYA